MRFASIQQNAKCGQGSAPDPAGELTSLPRAQTLAGFKGAALRQGRFAAGREKQRRRFPPASWVRTRPLLRPIKVHPIVDPTKFWEGVEDAHIRLWRRLHIGRECHVSHRSTMLIRMRHMPWPPAAISQPKNTWKCVGAWPELYPRSHWGSLHRSPKPQLDLHGGKAQFFYTHSYFG